MTTPREVLMTTLEDVEQSDTPEDLRAIAFSKVFDLRSGVSTPMSQPYTNPGPTTGAGSTTLTTSAPSDDLLTAIAARAATDRETVAEVFDQRNGELELIIGAGKLPSQVAAGTKEIALLMAGGRQAAGVEEWTALDVVRDVCADFKKLDSGNFSKTIRSMTDEFNVRKESDRKTVVRVSRPGWEAFAILIKRLSGTS
jgi:hypothetical protein